MTNESKTSNRHPQPPITFTKFSLRNQSSLTYLWGWVAILALTSALGLFFINVADTQARAGNTQFEGFFWLGLVLLVAPIAARLTSSKPRRRERIGLLIWLGLSLYFVKLLHSPYQFTFADEFVHSYNVEKILESGQLFNANLILRVTPLYPGLHIVTAAIASLSGLSTFSTGVLVIGIARLIEMLGLFFLYESISKSSRLAGLATLLYTTNPNFLFWSAQFSYQSLALPIAIYVLYTAYSFITTAEHEERIGYFVATLLGIVTVITTHHLTGYFLISIFVLWTVGTLIVRKLNTWTKAPQSNYRYAIEIDDKFALEKPNSLTNKRALQKLAGLTVFTITISLLWLFTVANITISYLAPVLGRAASSLFQIAAGTGTTRELFKSSSGYVAPLWERIMGVGSIVLLLLGLPFGLRRLWQFFRNNTLALLLALSALGYFGTFAMRISPLAWETANRASEFLFIGLAWICAFTAVEIWRTRRLYWLNRILILLAIGVIALGGPIAGWPPSARFSGPLQVNVGNVSIPAQSLSMAGWVRDKLGPDNRFLADDSNGRLLMNEANQIAWVGRNGNAADIIGALRLENWHTEVIQKQRIHYIVIDRRLISWNNMIGYYFDKTNGQLLYSPDMFDPKIYQKFDIRPYVNRIYDSGNILIYDVKVLRDGPPPQ